MKKGQIGQTVIDALTLCYVAESSLLNHLRSIKHCVTFDKFKFYRTLGRAHFQHFDITHNEQKVATAYFDRFGTHDDESYFWLRLENQVLYNSALMVEVLTLPELLDLTFNNITHLDLARDFNYNICERIRQLMRNPQLKTIINGKKVANRDEVIKGITRTCKISLSRDKTKSLTIKQAKAIKNKYDGITLDSYDKMDEITNKSEKQYIVEYYNNPKRLYRLELRLNNTDIKKIANSIGIIVTGSVVFEKECLDKLYIQALQSIIRFTKGRKKLDWDELFRCNGRYI